MARKVYMVDTENVSSSWRMMLADMTRNDVLYLFYTEHSPGIGYADFKEIMESETKPELISCYPGKNGLDFQLVSYLGYLLKSAGKTEYVIISNDMGYDCVIHFWKEQGYKVSRMTVYDLIQRKKARLEQEKAAEAPQGQEDILETSSSAKVASKKQNSLQEKKETDIAVKEQIFEENTNGIEWKETVVHSIQEQEKAIEEQKIDSENAPIEISQSPEVVPKEKETMGKRGRRKKQPDLEAVSVFVDSEDNLIVGTENNNGKGEGRKLLAELLAAHDVDLDTVIEILRHGSPHQLQKVYTQMLKLFGHQTGVELYHVLKPHFPVLFTYAKNGLEHGIDI